MTEPVEIVRSFYDKLEGGDAAGALGLMAPDMNGSRCGRGPEHVAEGLFKPLMAEWTTFAPCTHGVYRGRRHRGIARPITAVHGMTGKQAEARYAHVWTVRDGFITRFRQYIDTLAVAEARRA